MSKSEPWRVRLREAVRLTGKKHSAVAWAAGIDPATLSRVLTGATKKPSFDLVARIAEATGQPLGWIMHERGYEFTEQEPYSGQQA